MQQPFRTSNSVAGGVGRAASGCWVVVANLAAVVMAAVGAYFAYTSYQLVRGGQTTTGTVIDLDVSSSDDGGDTYAPIVEYTVGGQTYSFNTRNYSGPPAYHIGQQVTVLYDPANPKTVRINNFWELWLLPGILCPAALILAAATTGAFVLQRRRWR